MAWWKEGEGWKDKEKGDGWSGRRGRWFQERVSLLVVQICTPAKGWRPERVAEVLAGIIQDPGRFAYRQPNDQYHGRRYSAWTWKINEEAVTKAVHEFAAALNERVIQRQRNEQEERHARELALEAERFPTLDKWLSALHRKQLWTKGSYERHAILHLSESGRAKNVDFISAHEKREANWPRMCRQCGAEFTWAQVGRANVVRCGDCLPKRRQRGQASPEKEA